MKYIVLYSKKFSMEFPIIFPEVLVHADIADALKDRLAQFTGDLEVVSAGHVNSADFEGLCHGDSPTLNLKAHPAADTHLLMMNDYGAGATTAALRKDVDTLLAKMKPPVLRPRTGLQGQAAYDAALETECEKCGAEIGEPCLTAAGSEAVIPHAKRRRRGWASMQQSSKKTP